MSHYSSYVTNFFRLETLMAKMKKDKLVMTPWGDGEGVKCVSTLFTRKNNNSSEKIAIEKIKVTAENINYKTSLGAPLDKETKNKKMIY